MWLRATVDLPWRCALDLPGDYGGFFAGEDDYSWELAGYLGYRVTWWLVAYVGYRAQGQVRVTGEGPTQNGSDLVSHGPVIGVGFRF